MFLFAHGTTLNPLSLTVKPGVDLVNRTVRSASTGALMHGKKALTNGNGFLSKSYLTIFKIYFYLCSCGY